MELNGNFMVAIGRPDGTYERGGWGRAGLGQYLLCEKKGSGLKINWHRERGSALDKTLRT
jgi:hypothetical protein